MEGWRDEPLTVTFHALVDEAIEQRAAVVTEGWTSISVDLKLVFCSGILQKRKNIFFYFK